MVHQDIDRAVKSLETAIAIDSSCIVVVVVYKYEALASLEMQRCVCVCISVCHCVVCYCVNSVFWLLGATKREPMSCTVRL